MDNTKLKSRFYKLISNYLNGKIQLDSFRIEFDKLYYKHDYVETKFIRWYMEKLSFTTSDPDILSDPLEACTNSEDKLREYSRRVLTQIDKTDSSNKTV